MSQPKARVGDKEITDQNQTISHLKVNVDGDEANGHRQSSALPLEEPFGLFQLWPDPKVEDEHRIKTNVEYVLTTLICKSAGHTLKF